MSEEVFKPDDYAKEIYKNYKTEVEKRQLSSSENYDKAILTYSSAGLAISLTFLKDFIAIEKAHNAILLYGSWAFFVSATCITIISFLVSYKANECSLIFAEKYYMEGLKEYHNKQSFYGSVVEYANIASGLFFVLALIFTSFFVGLNLNEANKMTDKKSTAGYVQDGMPPALMQKIMPTTNTLQKGLPTPNMQQVPASAPVTAPAPAQSTAIVPTTVDKE